MPMQSPSILPPELDDARHLAIEQAWTGPPLPIDFDLTQWLEGDGWAALMALWDDWVAYHVDELSFAFQDDELRHQECLDEDDEVTDAMRLQYARERIAYALGGDDESVGRSVHVVSMGRADGKSAILGCTVQIQGQAGGVAEWQGAFPTRADFERHLRAGGYLARQEVEALDDAALLALWNEREEWYRCLREKASRHDDPDDASPPPPEPEPTAAITPQDRLAQIAGTMRFLSGSELLSVSRRTNAATVTTFLESLQVAIAAPVIDLDAIAQALRTHGALVATETSALGHSYMLRPDLVEDIHATSTLTARLLTARGNLMRVLAAFEKLANVRKERT